MQLNKNVCRLFFLYFEFNNCVWCVDGERDGGKCAEGSADDLTSSLRFDVETTRHYRMGITLANLFNTLFYSMLSSDVFCGEKYRFTDNSG